MANEERAGYWWTPELPEKRVPGTLHISDQNELKLVLIGGLECDESATPRRRAPLGLGEFKSIIGECESEPITLLDCQVFSRRSTLHGGEDYHQTIEASAGVLGASVTNWTDAEFNKICMQLENLGSMNGSPTGMNADGSIDLSDETGSPKQAEHEGVKYLLSFHNSNRRVDRLTSGVTISHQAYYTIDATFPEVLTFEKLIDHVRRVQDMVSFCANSSSAVVKAELRKVEFDENGEVELTESRPSLLVYSGLATLDPTAVAVWPEDTFVSFDTIKFEELIPRWFEFAKKFEIPLNMYLSSLYRAPTYLETRIVTSVTAAEAFHRLTDDHKALVDNDFALVLRKLDALPGELSDWAKRDMRNEPSLKERLVDLVRAIDSREFDNVIKDVNRWANLARNLRNNVAHGLKGADLALARQTFTVALVADAVFALSVLRWIGLSDDQISSLLTNNRHLVWCRQMAHKHL